MISTTPQPTGEDPANAWLTDGASVLVADSIAAARGRAFVGEHLTSGVDEFAHSVELLVSELVTNVVRHTQCDSLTLVILVGVDLVRVEVHDCDGVRFPHLAPLRPSEPGGVGLRLVDALAARWGSTSTQHGKCVWFEIPVAAGPMSHA